MYLQMQHLRCLLALEQHGSLTAAARALHLSQSALSHQIRGLERYFGISVFHRKSRPVRFTAAGQQLLELARQVLPRTEMLEQRLRRMGEGQTGRLHISMECHSCFQWLLPTLDAYRLDWPDTDVDLVQSHLFDPLPALRDGQLDLVIATSGVEDAQLVSVPLFTYESRLLLPVAHPLLRRSRIEAVDLAAETVITYPVALERLDLFSRFLMPAGVRPERIRTVESTLMIIQLVACGRGITALPAWVLDAHRDNQQLRSRSLGAEGVWVSLHAVMRKEEAGLPYMTAFLEQARETCFSRLSGIRH